jgi:hypothetical protein
MVEDEIGGFYVEENTEEKDECAPEESQSWT